MPMWGANLSDESLPKNLTTEQKTRVFADNRGWVMVRPGHRDASDGRHGKGEVLVSIKNLATKLGSSNVTYAYFVADSYSTGSTGKVRVTWNEKIVPTTTGTLTVKSIPAGTSVAVNITATRTGNTTSNFIEYSFTVPSTTGATLSIPAQTITQGLYGATTALTGSTVLATSNVIGAGTAFRVATKTTTSVTTTA